MVDLRKLLALAAVTGFLAAGCTQQKRIEGTEVPTQPPVNDFNAALAEQPAPPPALEAPPAEQPTAAPTQAPPPPPAANPCTGYIVVKGDTLWDIAGKSLAYHDNFQWPLIFKANRDQIKDPDLIYPKQDFCIRHDFTPAEVQKARQDASDTPKYVPHTQPREVLPIDYF